MAKSDSKGSKKGDSKKSSSTRSDSSKSGSKRSDSTKRDPKKKGDSKKSSKRDPGPSVKDAEVYEALRDDGASKEKAARIANASAAKGRKAVGKKGGKAEDYDDRTVKELGKRAKELGITGYSKLKKKELIEKLRNH